MKNWTLLCPTSDPHWTPKYNNVHATMSTLSHHWLHERCHQSWYNSIQFNSIHFNSMTTHLLVHKTNFPRWKREMQDVLCNTSYTSTVQQKKLFTDGPWTGPGHLCPTSDPLQTNKCVPYMMSYAMRTLHIIGYVTIPQLQHLETTQGTSSHSVWYP